MPSWIALVKNLLTRREWTINSCISVGKKTVAILAGPLSERNIMPGRFLKRKPLDLIKKFRGKWVCHSGLLQGGDGGQYGNHLQLSHRHLREPSGDPLRPTLRPGLDDERRLGLLHSTVMTLYAGNAAPAPGSASSRRSSFTEKSWSYNKELCRMRSVYGALSRAGYPHLSGPGQNSSRLILIS